MEEKIAHIETKNSEGGKIYILSVHGDGHPPRSFYYFSEAAAVSAAVDSGYKIVSETSNERKGKKNG